MRIYPLAEGTFTVGRDKVFVPFNKEKDVLEERPVGSLLVEIQPFLIQINDLNIIVDTGLGYALPDGRLQIHHNLAQLGVAPEEISIVLLSHLHKDHSGGISYINEVGQRYLSFPNAQYFIRAKEYAFAMQSEGSSYMKEELRFLEEHEQIQFLQEDEGWINSNIQYQHSGGHCPYHQVFTFVDGHEIAFFAGDEAAQLKQLKIRYVAKYDYDGKRAADLRQQYALKALEEHWTCLFYHDIAVPYAKLS